MASGRKPGTGRNGRGYRICGLCHAELYRDEPGIYCQDCRGVIHYIAAVHDRHKGPEPEAYRLAREAAHAERIARITEWVERARA